jgi:predicted dehydrogenase
MLRVARLSVSITAVTPWSMQDCALPGTGFGQAHAAVYAERPDVGQVVVFGRTPQKLAKISGRFGFATAADPDAAITEASVDLVDICLPTPLHAEVAVRANAGRPRRAHRATAGRHAR